MAQAFDATSKSFANTLGAKQITLALTIGSLTNGVLIVDNWVTSGTAVSATFNGVSMTKITSSAQNSSWFISNLPAAGTYNVVVNFSAAYVSQDTVATSFSGVNQSIPTNFAYNSQTVGATTDAPNTLTVSLNSWLHMGVFVPATGDSLFAGTSTTLRGSGGGGGASMDLNSQLSAGSQTINSQTASTDTHLSIVLELQLPVSASLPPRWKFGQAVNRASTY